MFGIQNYASFVLAILAFQMTPGPGAITILNATARGGVRAGLTAVFGTLSGDFIYMVSAAAGLAAVMHANPMVFNALQWFGAGYLCWMGLQLLRAKARPAGAQVQAARSRWSYFRQAFAVAVTNPKVIMFFVAFFPLFLRVDSSAGTLIAMMVHVTTLSFIYQLSLVLVGNAVAQRLHAYPYARRLTACVAGSALIAFGVKLAASNR